MRNHFKKILQTFVCAVLCLSLFAGCEAETITVAYTVYPVEYILSRVAGNRVNVANLSDGVNPIQTAQIAPDYMDTLDNAALVLEIGDLEPYRTIYDEDIRNSKADIVDLSGLAAIYDFCRYTTGTISGSTVTVESSWYEGDLFNAVDMYEKEMCLWMDPIAMTSMARSITEWLTANDPNPNNKVYYQENFSDLEADLVRLDSEYSAIADDGIKLVTVTPSFGAWQKSYNIGIYPLILSRYGALPTESQLAVIEQRIRQDGVRYIVRESNMTEEMTALFERVKADCSLEEISLSNLSTLTESEYNQNKDYLTIMYDNLTTLESLQ